MTEPLIIACVKEGKRFGACYPNLLYDMVRRHVPPDMPFTFMCFTDRPDGLHPDIVPHTLPGDLTGWWNKLYMFKEGVFSASQRVVYVDLDTLITGSLEPLLRYRGEFAILRDFYRPDGYGSGVMLWRGGAGHAIWASYEAAGKPLLAGGDQAWIERAYANADRLQDIFPGMLASYKADCHPLPPDNTRVVCFHGEPKQDNCDAPWVRDLWRIGGAKTFPARATYRTAEEETLAHVRHAITLPHAWLAPASAHKRPVAIIGGGPSLYECIAEIRCHRENGDSIFAINNAAAWLTQHGLGFDAHIMAHARREHADCVPADENVLQYYASTCHPAVFEKARGRVVVWHPRLQAMTALPKDDKRPKLLLEGTTAGINAIHLAHALGYRHMHLYGFDSCYTENGEHHAYAQNENDKDRIFDIEVRGQHFGAALWMTAQIEEFIILAEKMIANGCVIDLYSDGLLPFMAGQMAR